MSIANYFSICCALVLEKFKFRERGKSISSVNFNASSTESLEVGSRQEPWQQGAIKGSLSSRVFQAVLQAFGSPAALEEAEKKFKALAEAPNPNAREAYKS